MSKNYLSWKNIIMKEKHRFLLRILILLVAVISNSKLTTFIISIFGFIISNEQTHKSFCVDFITPFLIFTHKIGVKNKSIKIGIKLIGLIYLISILVLSIYILNLNLSNEIKELSVIWKEFILWISLSLIILTASIWISKEIEPFTPENSLI